MAERSRSRGPAASAFASAAGLVAAVALGSCGPQEVRPVEIFPEDQCASCRMAVSDQAFASQIVYDDGSAVKFDDLGCFDNFRRAHPGEPAAGMFVANYETKEWIPYGKSVIVQTGIETPMGSGRVAVADQAAANRLKRKFPPKIAASGAGGCCSAGGH